jgi:hypothetical protein
MEAGGQRHDPADLPQRRDRVTILQGLSEPQGLSLRLRKNPPPLRFDLRIFPSVVSRYTDYTTPSHPNQCTVL